MSNFKPQVTIITEETRRDYANCYGKKSPCELPTHSKADGLGFGGHRLT